MEKKPIISLVSAMVCTRNITDAVIEIKEEYGDIFEFKLYFVNEINQQPKIQDQFRKDIVNSHTLMIDIRGHNKTVEIILNTLKNLKREKPANYEKKNIISLVGGNQEIRELTRIGSFDASKIPPGGSEEYGFEKIPELTDLVKKGIRISNTMAKIGKYFPFGMLKHLRNWMRIMDYWVYGHSGVPENFTYMLLMILKEYAGLNKPKIKKIPSPQKIPEYGIFDPILNQYFSSLDQYLQVKKYNEDKQTIGIFYYGGIYFEQSIPVLKQFMHQFSEYNVIPVFSETLENITALEEFFMNENGPLVDTVINLQYFQINGGPFGGDNYITLDLYERLNVPQFNPIINYDMKASEYLDSDKGIIPINQVIAIVMPELDGRIEMMCAGYMRSMGLSNEINSEVLDIQPYEKNIEFITERIRNWLRLRKLSNQQKKIAFIIYDYPPGEDRFANASYLDVFSSLVRILSRLEKQGYKLGKL